MQTRTKSTLIIHRSTSKLHSNYFPISNFSAIVFSYLLFFHSSYAFQGKLNQHFASISISFVCFSSEINEEFFFFRSTKSKVFDVRNDFFLSSVRDVSMCKIENMKYCGDRLTVMGDILSFMIDKFLIPADFFKT